MVLIKGGQSAGTSFNVIIIHTPIIITLTGKQDYIEIRYKGKKVFIFNILLTNKQR